MSGLKKFAVKYLPAPILKIIKQWHYLRKINKVDENSEEDIFHLKSFIKPGDIVIDIGANFGVFTKIMSICTGEKGKVYSFEPIAETFSYLRNNVNKLRLSNVILYNLALSDTKGKAIMEVPKYEHSGENFYEARIVEKKDSSLKTYEIKTDTLDNLFEKTSFNPAFIKCDVEGHEWAVFLGSRKLLEKCNPVLLVELNQNLSTPDYNTELLLNYFKSLGYHLFINKNNKLNTWRGEKMSNYYFLKDKHIKEFLDIIQK